MVTGERPCFQTDSIEKTSVFVSTNRNRSSRNVLTEASVASTRGPI